MTTKFFEQYVEMPAGTFIEKKEKAELIASATPFPIVAVQKVKDTFSKEEGAQRYIVLTEIDGEARKLGFGAGSVTSRDSLLDAATEYLKTEGAVPPVVAMSQQGRAIALIEAEF